MGVRGGGGRRAPARPPILETDMKSSLAAVAALTLVATPALAKPSEAEIARNFDRWAAALATKDPKTVAALFAPNAILEPTVSNEIRTTPARVEAYFVDFLKLSPKPTINERHIEVLDRNTALEAGVWTFDLTRDGTPSWVTARYSFIWEKIGGQWKIQLLHSSMMPEPLSARPAPIG
jgi:uncharacterized protein (TIGR02246 family)